MTQNAFHDVRFPLRIAFGATVSPERRTEIVTLGSGFEERNTRWAHSRRQYDAGQGVRSLDDLHEIIAFFEERRGRLFGFRFHDRVDCRSGPPSRPVTAFDQDLGEGDGTTKVFQLVKTYGGAHNPYRREIRKPVAASLRAAVSGTVLQPGFDFDIDPENGLITFAQVPPPGARVTAGFEFDVPVRFATDRLDINLATFKSGDIPSIPLVEIRL
ncbi:MAG: DUF2460 domain-containing protein [Rhizobiales bacterium]|nr:DUF2460 domain-containing protein [Hyphomicrobiales bacterium]